MKEDVLARVQKLDQWYFGTRSLPKLIRAMAAQVASMHEEPTPTNVHKQSGDLLFVLASVARNNGWNLDEMLESAVIKLECRRDERHYYESHVTIEPVFEERLVQLKEIAESLEFYVADLVMQKRPTDTPERSKNDAFCTARGISKSDLTDRTVELCTRLRAAGFMVWRFKVESTVLDSRYDDSLFPLQRDQLPEKERDPRAPATGSLAGRRE